MYEIHEFVRRVSGNRKFSRKLTSHEEFIEAVDRLALLDKFSKGLKYSYEIYDIESNMYLYDSQNAFDRAQNSMVQRGNY